MNNPNEVTDSKRFKEIINGIEEAVILSYLDGTIFFTNKSCEPVFGLTEKDLIGKKVSSLSDEKTLQVIESRALKGSSGSKFEYSINKKGETKWVSHSWNILGVNHEQIIVNIIRDITSQVLIHEKLKESEEKYRKIFDLSPEVIILINNKGKVLEINKRTEEWIGYAPEEIIGKSILSLEFIPMESKTLILENFGKRILGKEVEPYEIEFITKNKERKIGRINGTTIKDEKFNTIHDLVMISDVTEIKKKEEELRKTKEIYENVFENANDLIQRCDEKGNLIEVNSKWSEVLGYSKEEAKKMNLMQIIEKPHVNECMNKFSEVMKGKKVSGIKTVFISKKGKKIELEVNAAPLYDRNKKIISTLGIFREINQEKEKKFKLF
ncbi:MAG: PAS domain-containing protein [Candidatus Diapherotrites archaeon]|nr:PAS domain-containing protein [Candidatus Diapherotrites archaeon]